jgi:hypothetical protein
MHFIFSTPELNRHLWQLKTSVFMHWCLICAVPFRGLNGVEKNWVLMAADFFTPLLLLALALISTKVNA